MLQCYLKVSLILPSDNKAVSYQFDHNSNWYYVIFEAKETSMLRNSYRISKCIRIIPII